MNKNDYTIRLEEKKDYRAVENLVREAFWNGAEHDLYCCAQNGRSESGGWGI